MTAQSAPAPVAAPTGEIDLTHHPTACKPGSVCGHNFSDKLVSRRAGETVIAAKKLEVCIADAPAKQANDRIAFSAARLCCLSYRCSPLF